jgi:hypothetical protein
MIVLGSLQGTYTAFPAEIQSHALSQMQLALSTAKVQLSGGVMSYTDNAEPNHVIGNWTSAALLDSVRQAAADYSGSKVLQGFKSDVLFGFQTVPSGYANLSAWYQDFYPQFQKFMNDAFVNVLGLPAQPVY